MKPAELAAYLAARMCHDFISPASAIVSGLDLLEDPTAQDMREDAMGLISASARKLADLLAFTRVAFGASASAQTFDPRELETLARGVFGHMRAAADLVGGGAKRAQAGGPRDPEPRPDGRRGAAHRRRLHACGPSQDGGAIAISSRPQARAPRLRAEVLAGLQGEGPGDGLHGHWVQARYVNLFVGDAGGRVSADVGEERVTLSARRSRV